LVSFVAGRAVAPTSGCVARDSETSISATGVRMKRWTRKKDGVLVVAFEYAQGRYLLQFDPQYLSLNISVVIPYTNIVSQFGCHESPSKLLLFDEGPLKQIRDSIRQATNKVSQSGSMARIIN
jgi:hypothetical protein